MCVCARARVRRCGGGGMQVEEITFVVTDKFSQYGILSNLSLLLWIEY
jgi:hypothetical protein